MLALLFATDPNNAIVSNPTSLAALIDPSATITSFLNNHVTDWTLAAWDTSIVPNGTASISGLFSPPVEFVLGKHYYAFVGGGTVKSGTVFTDPSVGYTLSVGAVPEPGEWAMMIAGLGLIGAIRRRKAAALA